MGDDAELSINTWSRNVEVVKKIGFRDGAADGRAYVFQSSFDLGYKQGFSFGIEQGLNNALKGLQQGVSPTVYLNNIPDPRNINCQLCLHGIPPNLNLGNLYNNQLEKNNELCETLGIQVRPPIALN